MGNNITSDSSTKADSLVILDNDFTIKHTPKTSTSSPPSSDERHDGSLHLEVLKPLVLTFLDPFSSDGEETIELDMRVTANATEIKSNAN